MNTIIYYLHLIPALLLQVFVFKTKTYYEDDSRQNQKIKGCAIIVSNHRSFLDGPVIALRFFFKRLHFIAADFYKNRLKIVKFVISAAGGIFVDNEVGFAGRIILVVRAAWRRGYRLGCGGCRIGRSRVCRRSGSRGGVRCRVSAPRRGRRGFRAAAGAYQGRKDDKQNNTGDSLFFHFTGLLLIVLGSLL